MSGENGWNEYQKLVLTKLEEYNDHFEKIYRILNETRIDIAALKVKSGVWGAVAGGLTVAVILLIAYLKGI